MSNVGIIVVTHGVFGREMLRTAQDIVGRQENVFDIAVTSEVGVQGVSQALNQALSDMSGLEGRLIFVDMLGGTPCNVSLPLSKDPATEVITGINLYMLISAFRNRPTLGFKELVQKVIEDGRKSILLPKELLSKRSA